MFLSKLKIKDFFKILHLSLAPDCRKHEKKNNSFIQSGKMIFLIERNMTFVGYKKL